RTPWPTRWPRWRTSVSATTGCGGSSGRTPPRSSAGSRSAAGAGEPEAAGGAGGDVPAGGGDDRTGVEPAGGAGHHNLRRAGGRIDVEEAAVPADDVGVAVLGQHPLHRPALDRLVPQRLSGGAVGADQTEEPADEHRRAGRSPGQAGAVAAVAGD